MKRFISVCVFSFGRDTAAAMGSGSGGGGGGSAASNPLQQEVGASAFKAYNQGVDLMHVRKFAAAQIKFEQAIGDTIDRPNLGQYSALQPRFFSNQLGYRICRETAALNLNVLQNALS